ncbi:hypothetical protein GCM10020358_78360 [Amorphoplanes nipponensis]|uniref:Uncharacterized protein n=1 Tax=Actinoplanes nipponensis TaxID=135950 RepID=A0A919JNB5_9ACTN|nr:hypothetical protein Ani05nite_63120 [Actinoplanes nipponensis]
MLSRYSFSRMRSDQEGAKAVSHYRKGKAGDWPNQDGCAENRAALRAVRAGTI